MLIKEKIAKSLIIKEIVEFLRLSECSVLYYIEKRGLETIKVGYWRIKESDLE